LLPITGSGDNNKRPRWFNEADHKQAWTAFRVFFFV